MTDPSVLEISMRPPHWSTRIGPIARCHSETLQGGRRDAKFLCGDFNILIYQEKSVETSLPFEGGLIATRDELPAQIQYSSPEWNSRRNPY